MTTERADVVIVGAGIIGASIAYQLARRSSLRVIVLDKGAGPGEGSTGASSSISRCRYTDPRVVRLAFCGQRAYREWSSFTGLRSPRSSLHQVGVVWLLGHERSQVDLEVGRLRQEGAAAERIGPRELEALFPALSPCVAPLTLGEEHACRPGEAFLFEPDGGYADPVGALQDLIEAARREGAAVRFGSRVTGLRKTGERVAGVETAEGARIDAGLVVNAAGPWCNQLNRMAGLDLEWRLTPTRVQTLQRAWPPELGPLPVGADASTGIYFRPQGASQVVVGSVAAEDEEEVVEDPDEFKRSPDAGFRELKMAAFHHRVPRLEARGQVGGIAGLYTINREDVHPLLGPSGVEGFWLANGFSGHGFKLAPMIGSMIARALTETEAPFDTDLDISLFAADREPIGVEAKNVLA